MKVENLYFKDINNIVPIKNIIFKPLPDNYSNVIIEENLIIEESLPYKRKVAIIERAIDL